MSPLPPGRVRPGAAALFAWLGAAVGLGAGAGGCGIAPWSMGAPLNGKPSIPATTQAPSIARMRVLARGEHAAGHPALELRWLREIARAQRLTQDERERLAPLLEQRATQLLAMGRAVPACDDLTLLQDLAPARASALATVHARAQRDAGDAWLAVGDDQRARAAYQVAASLGADATDVRMAAASGQALPSNLADAAVERAILELPLRAVPPFAAVYLARGDDTLNRAALERALRAARQEKKLALATRIDGALSRWYAAAPAPAALASGATPESTHDATRDDPWDQAAEALLDAPAVPVTSPAPADGGALDDWVLATAAVSSRLLPLLQHSDALLAPGPRSRTWGQLLLDEDPTSPDVLEISAVIDGLAGRVGGAERKLTDLVYFSPDRALGLVRAAAVWQRVGQVRLACVAWLRAARWRDDVDDPAWRQAIDCTRGDPGAGDWRAIRQYVLARAPAGRRPEVAARLDAATDATPSSLSAPVSVPRDDGPIPCDTGGRFPP